MQTRTFDLRWATIPLISFAAMVAPAACSTACGAIIFSMERISDTKLKLSATGTFDGATPSARGARIYLVDPFATSPSTITATNNTLTNITKDPDALMTSVSTLSLTVPAAGSKPLLLLNMAANNTAGEELTGSVILELSLGTWKNVGWSNLVYYGSDGNGVVTRLTGSYTISQSVVPEPTTLTLAGLGVGMAALLRVRQRRRSRTAVVSAGST